jgi:hypothetical protein
VRARHLPPAQHEPLGERLEQVELLTLCGDARRAGCQMVRKFGGRGVVRLEGELDAVTDASSSDRARTQGGGCSGAISMSRTRHPTARSS